MQRLTNATEQSESKPDNSKRIERTVGGTIVEFIFHVMVVYLLYKASDFFENNTYKITVLSVLGLYVILMTIGAFSSNANQSKNSNKSKVSSKSKPSSKRSEYIWQKDDVSELIRTSDEKKLLPVYRVQFRQNSGSLKTVEIEAIDLATAESMIREFYNISKSTQIGIIGPVNDYLHDSERYLNEYASRSSRNNKNEEYEPEPEGERKYAGRNRGDEISWALDVIGLEEGRTKEEISAKCKALMKLYHPDLNGGNRTFESLLAKTIEASSILKREGLA